MASCPPVSYTLPRVNELLGENAYRSEKNYYLDVITLGLRAERSYMQGFDLFAIYFHISGSVSGSGLLRAGLADVDISDRGDSLLCLSTSVS